MDIDQVAGQVERIAAFITSPFFIWLWCTVVAAYTFRWLVKLKWEGVKIRTDLQRAMDVVAAPSGYEQFAKEFDDINLHMARLSKLSRPWKEFCQTLLKPQVSASDENQTGAAKPFAMRASREPSEFFNEHSIIQPHIDLRFFSAIPTHLNGLGILGTFCGLSAGIYLARNGLGADTVEELRQSLVLLLGGASLAFCTSIIGVFCSILFSKVEKLAIKGLSQQIDTLNVYLANQVQFISAEQIADQRLEQHLKQNSYLADLVSHVQTLYKQQKQINEKTLHKIVNEFRIAMTQSTGDEVKNIAKGFRSIVEALTYTRNAVDDSGKKLEIAAEKASQHFETRVVQSAQHFDRISEQAADRLASSLKEAGKSMSTTIETAAEQSATQLTEPSTKLIAQMELLTSKAAQAIEQFGAVVTNSKEHNERVGEVQQRMCDMMGPIIGAAKDMERIFENTQQLLHQSSNSSEAIQESVNRIEFIQQKLETHWESYCTRFEHVDDQLRSAISSTNDSLASYSEKVKSFTSDLDKHMSKGILSLAGAVGDLHQVVGHLPDAIREAK